MSCCYKVVFFIIHCIAHFFFYLLPNCGYYLCCCCCCCVDDDEDGFTYRPDIREVLLVYKGAERRDRKRQLEIVEGVFGFMHTYPHPYEDRQWYITDADAEDFERAESGGAVSQPGDDTSGREECMTTEDEGLHSVPDGSEPPLATIVAGDVCYDCAFKVPYERDPDRIRISRGGARRTELDAVRKRALKRLHRRRDELLLRYNSPLYNKHMGTILGVLRPFEEVDYDAREDVPSWDGCELMLRWSYCRTKDEDKGSGRRAAAESHEPVNDGVGGGAEGLVIMLPGLTSHPQTCYVTRFVRALNAGGFHVCVITVRGIGESKQLTRPFLFNGAYTRDVHFLMENYFTRERIAARFGSGASNTFLFPIIGLGLSIGGAIMSKYLGEVGKRGGMTPLDAALSVCAPNDFVSVVENMNRHHHYLQRLIYQPDMCGDVRGYFVTHRHQFAKMPNLNAEYIFGTDEGGPANIERFTRVLHFDRHIMVPGCGYRSIHHYHLDASALMSVMYTPVPLCVVSTRDDPVIGPGPLPHRWEEIAENNRNVVYCELPCGGHLGFLGGPLNEACRSDDFMHRFVLLRLRAIRQYWLCNLRRESPADVDAEESRDEDSNSGSAKATGSVKRPIMMTPREYKEALARMQQRRETAAGHSSGSSIGSCFHPPLVVNQQEYLNPERTHTRGSNAYYFSSVFSPCNPSNDTYEHDGGLYNNNKGILYDIETGEGEMNKNIFAPIVVNCDYTVDTRTFMSGA